MIQTGIPKANNGQYFPTMLSPCFILVYVDQLEEEGAPVLEGTPFPLYMRLTTLFIYYHKGTHKT